MLCFFRIGLFISFSVGRINQKVTDEFLYIYRKGQASKQGTILNIGNDLDVDPEIVSLCLSAFLLIFRNFILRSLPPHAHTILWLRNAPKPREKLV